MNRICQTWRVNSPPHSDPNSGLLRPVQMAPQPKTLDQASLALPSGVYTTFRTYQRTRVFRFDSHLARLEESARLAGVPIKLNRERSRQSVREAVRLYGEEEARIRLTVDLEVEPGRLFVSIEPLVVPPPESYRLGVRTITRCMQRANPEAKLTSFLTSAATLRTELPPGVNEVLMIDGEGHFLEGLSSNFFAVNHDQLWTAGSGVLNGITRKIVLEEAENVGIPVVLSAPSIRLLQEYQEAFITSASRSVLPVVQVDGRLVGPGRPGPVSEGIRQKYESRILAEAEEI